jgi:hypothetical protein
MANGYSLFSKLHPVGGLYRYKAPFGYVAGLTPGWRWHNPWSDGKVYLLTKWERPEGIDKKSPIINAFFLVNGTERCVDVSFFKHLEQVE